ncbi:hypothetical protein L873DRAFT_1794936 [Choiromyces venosus 120613-1]|uniref:Uncharacterized protein n=1 Tax=Choiromyces venosus 120613-1 TaxID=1336337 RepID=A0A3N4IYS4_9PEZI|nr:hypothetical protein L873DRAFT_1794936 [Choiromyces venosus 120613-1]
MSTPAERKNQQVWDSIEAGALKQALQQCNRRLKKGEKGDYLQILKAHTLTLLGAPANSSEALQIAQQLSSKTPPIDSLDCLRLLTRVWNGLGGAHTREISQLWERAVKVRPGDESLAREWLWGTVRSLDWRGAQKAAMSLQKSFPARREYWFWAAVTCLLLHNSLSETTAAGERKLFGTLAYKMLAKSRDDTPLDTTVVPPRAMQTSQEVNLLLELLAYVSPDAASKEALELLDSKNLGVDSKIGAGDWWGLARKRLEVLEGSKDWKALWEVCRELVKDEKKKEDEAAVTENGEEKKTNGEENAVAKKDGADDEVATKGRGDDWLIWKCFVKAVGELWNSGEKEPGKIALEIILAHCSASATTRNPNLALVKFSSVFHDEHGGPEGTPTLLEACKEYFTKTGTKSACFEDLKVYLEMLEETETEEFLKFVAKRISGMSEETETERIKQVAATINRYKFIYLLTISPITPPLTEEVVSKLNEFITSALKVYTSSLSLGHNLLQTDTQYGDDAALLSVMGLVRLSALSDPPSPVPLYQSTIILNTLLQKSKYNYQALLLLLRIYLLLGAIPLAMEIYPRLNIKQIQNDTLAHFLLTRISTLHPSSNRTDPLLKEAGKIYETSRTQTPGMLVLAYERGSYSQMMGFVEFAERVSGSVCRGMWEIEKRRLARLHPSLAAQQKNGELMRDGDENIWDNRDFSVVISCERSSQQRFEETFRVGATPGENWAKGFSAVERLVEYFRDPSVSFPGAVEGPIPAHVLSVLTRILPDQTAMSEFTPVEATFLSTIQLVVTFLTTPATETESLKSTLSKFTSSLPTPPPASLISSPHAWEYLHTANTILDLVTILQGHFIPHVKQKKLMAELSAAVEALKKTVMTNAATLAKEIEEEEESASDAEQELIDGVLALQGVGRELRDWGVEGGVVAVRGVRKSLAAAVAGVGKGKIEPPALPESTNPLIAYCTKLPHSGIPTRSNNSANNTTAQYLQPPALPDQEKKNQKHSVSPHSEHRHNEH